uniref:DNA-binding protein SATB n=1 Tax=Macrostomum lignano TaxID=282301 RepID=A0A1I8ICZ2_9PLAT
CVQRSPDADAGRVAVVDGDKGEAGSHSSYLSHNAVPTASHGDVDVAVHEGGQPPVEHAPHLPVSIDPADAVGPVRQLDSVNAGHETRPAVQLHVDQHEVLAMQVQSKELEQAQLLCLICRLASLVPQHLVEAESSGDAAAVQVARDWVEQPATSTPPALRQISPVVEQPDRFLFTLRGGSLAELMSSKAPFDAVPSAPVGVGGEVQEAVDKFGPGRVTLRAGLQHVIQGLQQGSAHRLRRIHYNYEVVLGDAHGSVRVPDHAQRGRVRVVHPGRQLSNRGADDPQNAESVAILFAIMQFMYCTSCVSLPFLYQRPALRHLGPNPSIDEVCQPDSISKLIQFLRATRRASFFPTEDHAAGRTGGPTPLPVCGPSGASGMGNPRLPAVSTDHCTLQLSQSELVNRGGIGDPHPAGILDEGVKVTDVVEGGQLVHPLGVAEVLVPHLVEEKLGCFFYSGETQGRDEEIANGLLQLPHLSIRAAFHSFIGGRQHQGRQHQTRQHQTRQHQTRQHQTPAPDAPAPDAPAPDAPAPDAPAPDAPAPGRQHQRQHQGRQHQGASTRQHQTRQHQTRQHQTRQHQTRQHQTRQHQTRQHQTRQHQTRQHQTQHQRQQPAPGRQHQGRQSHCPRPSNSLEFISGRMSLVGAAAEAASRTPRSGQYEDEKDRVTPENGASQGTGELDFGNNSYQDLQKMESELMQLKSSLGGGHELHQLANMIASLKESIGIKIKALEQELAARDETINNLRAELLQYSDYASIKERLFRLEQSSALEEAKADCRRTFGAESLVLLGSDRASCPIDLGGGTQTSDCFEKSLKRQLAQSPAPIPTASPPEEVADGLLDTNQIAGQVRDLLSSHSIGQRLFARHVLGLSQGTVSELLSKPKPWEKLTEKGRESYRKMSGWAASADNVAALKALCPAKKTAPSVVMATGPAQSQASPTPPIQTGTQSRPAESSPTPGGEAASIEKLRREIRNLEAAHPELKETKRLNSAAAAVAPKLLQQQQQQQPLLLQPARTQVTISLIAPPKLLESQPTMPTLPSSVAPGGSTVGDAIDTDDLVRRVKEVLAQHSISQRLFGEHVLGLSQGSVSDLLARPKPWPVLTQKGREPFTPDAPLPGGASRLRQPPADRRQRLGRPNAAECCVRRVDELGDVLGRVCRRWRRERRVGHAGDVHVGNEERDTLSNNWYRCPLPIAVQLMSQLGLGWKQLADSVFNQAVDEAGAQQLLASPRAWSELDSEERELYKRLSAWLAANSMPGTKSMENRGNRRSGPSSFDSSPEAPTAAKKGRYLFTETQKAALASVFSRDPYPSAEQVESLACDFGLPLKTVSNWFHNHRMRSKTNGSAAASRSATAAATNTGATSAVANFNCCLGGLDLRLLKRRRQSESSLADE